MTFKEAWRIKELRIGEVKHTLRRISEIICDEYPNKPQSLRGNQLYGEQLCRDAMTEIYNRILRDIPQEIRQEWDI